MSHAGALAALGLRPDLELVAEIGSGTGTVVYRARRQSHDVAIKVFTGPDHRETCEDTLRTLRREAALLASLDHADLPQVYEIGAAAGQPYLVMDLVEGRPLSRVLGDGPLPQEHAAGIVAELAGALAAVHRAGVVHRDIKSHNIMILDDGRARLIDFGLATRSRGDRDGVTVGTLGYAAPEQCGTLDRAVDARSDLYSLGVVLFECLTGRLPFRTDDVAEMLRLHAAELPPDLRELVPGVSGRLARIVATLLAKDPDDRYQHAVDLAADLGRPVDLPAADRHPLVGRGEEMSRLTARWTEALAGQGGVCLVRGPGGAGKTRVAAQLAAVARAGGALVLTGACNRDDATPLAGLRMALEGYVRSLDGLPDDERAAAVRLVRDAAGDAAGVLAQLSAPLGTLLDGPGVEPLDELGDKHEDRFVVALVDFLTELAGRVGGLLLQLDDLHWSGQGSLQALALLQGACRRAGERVCLLVVATARDDHTDTAVSGQLSTLLSPDLDLVLPPLTEAEVADLVRACLPGLGADSSFGRLLARQGAGNPFVIGEYLRAAVDAGVLSPSWGTWSVDESALAMLTLDADVLGLVLGRLGRLSPDSRRVLCTAALIGARMRPSVLAAVSGISAGQAGDAVREAILQGLVEQSAGGEVSFLHDQTRQALIETLDADERARLHRAAADTLAGLPDPAPPEVYAAAGHYVAWAGLTGAGEVDPMAVRACLAAGRLALADQAPEQAVQFFEHAEQVGAAVDAHFQAVLGQALQHSGRYRDAQVRLRGALEQEPTAAGRAMILLHLSDVCRSSWRPDAGVAAAQQGLAELGAGISPHPLVRVLSALGLFVAGVLVGVTRIGRGGARGARFERFALITALHTSAVLSAPLAMRPMVALEHSLRMVYPTNRQHRGRAYATSQGGLAVAAAITGLDRTARWCRAQAERAGREVGDPGLVADTRLLAGAAAYLAGADDGQRWAGAINEHGRWVEGGLFDDSVGCLALEAVVRGQTQEAVAWYERGLARRQWRPAQPDELTSVDSVGISVHALAGRPIQAAAELSRFRSMLAPGGRVQANLAFAELFCVLEQGEVGMEADAAVRKLELIGPAPRFAMRTNRFAWGFAALVRLSQCWAAPEGPLRERRVAEARLAVKRLRSSPRDPFVVSLSTICTAELWLLRGRPERALSVLEKLRPGSVDMPLQAFEAARVRARAFRALGYGEEAARQARYAHDVAVQHAWPGRLRRIRDEFGQAVATMAGSRMSIKPRTSKGVGGGQESRWLEALQVVTRATARVVDPEALARIALDETISLVNAERAVLFLEQPARPCLPVWVARDLNGQDLPEVIGYSATLVEQVWASGETLVVAGTDQGLALGSESVLLHNLRSILIAPLRLDERVIGVVYLDSRVARGIFTEEHARLLSTLTDHIALSLETARAAQLEVDVQAAQRQRDLAQSLHDAFRVLSASLDPEQVQSRLVEQAVRVLSVTDAYLLACSTSGVELVHSHRGGVPSRQPLPDRPDVAALLALGEPVDGGGTDLPALLAETIGPVDSWLAVPLTARDQRIGTLLVTSEGTGHFGMGEIEVAAAFAAQAATACDNAALFARIEELAVVDELTGIPNRRRFLELADLVLAAARAEGHPVVALMVDIDRFKRINDGHGHPTGDDVIQQVAGRLTTLLRPSDVVARYGGEEFAVLLPHTGLAAGYVVAERLRAGVADPPVPTRSGSLPVTISVGVATGSLDLRELLAGADVALYDAKHAGRNRVSGPTDPWPAARATSRPSR